MENTKGDEGDLLNQVHIAEYELMPHENSSLSQFAGIVEENIDVLRHAPDYLQRRFGVTFRIPTLKHVNEVKIFGEKSKLDIIGYSGLNGNTLVLATLADVVLDEVIYETPFSSIESHSFDRGEKECLTVSTLYKRELPSLKERLKKAIGPEKVKLKSRRREDLAEFITEGEICQVPLAPWTGEEQRLISTAMEMGYLDVPRRANLDVLSSRTGVPKSTLSNQLRKIYKKMLHSHFVESLE